MSESIATEEVAVGIPPLTLGWRMQMAMEHGGRSIADMAYACGVARSTISRWIHDTGKRPRRGDLEVWARECRVPFAWLAPNPEELSDWVQPTLAKTTPKLSLVRGKGSNRSAGRPVQSPLMTCE